MEFSKQQNNQYTISPNWQQVITMSLFLPAALAYFTRNKTYHPFLFYIYFINVGYYLLIMVIYRFSFYTNLEHILTQTGDTQKLTLAVTLFPIAIILAFSQFLAGLLAWLYCRNKQEIPKIILYVGLVIYVFSILILALLIFHSMSAVLNQFPFVSSTTSP